MTLLLALLAFTNPEVIDLQYRAHIRFLADDLLEGRDTAERGQKIAARYLASQMALAGVQPGLPDTEDPYFQTFGLTADSLAPNKVQLKASGSGPTVHLNYGKEFDSLSLGDFEVEAPMIFVGYGLETDKYSDYEGVDVKGRWVLIMEGNPSTDDKDSIFSKMNRRDLNTWRRFRRARTKGALGVIYLKQTKLISMGEMSNLSLEGEEEDRKPPSFIMLRVAKEKQEALTGRYYKRIQKSLDDMLRTQKPQSFELKRRTLTITQEADQHILTTENVVGILPGSDPKLRDEYLVVSAHYDHVGVRGKQVYNGADDNASGTTTVLLLGEHLQRLERRRSIILLLVSGEEKGLLGSEYFVKNPIVPKEQIVGNINLDMIGRNKTGEMGIIPAETQGLTNINEIAFKVNEEGGHGFKFLTDWDRYNRRSDHYNFARAGIPAVFFFAGTHEDYHEPGDDWHKLNYEKITAFYGFLEELMVKLANADDRPYFVKPPGGGSAQPMNTPPAGDSRGGGKR
ncbi:MAG: M28 family peptidase [Acidobacteriota bacterium]|nr:M28 family peptidase [Acidobacteriota bacterium]